MPTQKRSNFSINFSQNTIQALIYMGYLDGNKKAKKTRKNKGETLSQFVNRCIKDHIKLSYPLVKQEIEVKAQFLKLQSISRKQEKLQKELELEGEIYRQLLKANKQVIKNKKENNQLAATYEILRVEETKLKTKV